MGPHLDGPLWARIDKEIGFGNITDIVWDTDERGTSIGVDPKLKTSSDMFVRTEGW
ncbi:MAG: hypothetical protein CM15mL4_3100 [uncultured marine virus]|nr:MAG: hypothetical protein CM15mL4_3100 [uncultured marine virus]